MHGLHRCGQLLHVQRGLFGVNWGDPTGSQMRHLLFEIHYL